MAWRCTSNVRSLSVGASSAFQRVMPSSRNAWKFVAFADVPWMKRAMWRWKLSRDVVPRAHGRTGSWTPPFFNVALLAPHRHPHDQRMPPLYGTLCSDSAAAYSSGTPGGSCRHATCRRCSAQIVVISSVSRGTPSVSVASASARRSVSMAVTVASVPRVLLRQCRARSSRVIAFRMADSDGDAMLASWNLALFACCSSLWSSASHSNMQPLNPSAGRRRASAGHRLCEFQKSWHRPGIVRRADARTTSAGGIKYV